MTLFLILLSAAALFYAWVIFLLFRGLRRGRPGRNLHPHFVSVVVAARNEETLIQRCLSGLLAQNYPGGRFEIIAVDDRSQDATLEKIKALETRDSRLRGLPVKSCPAGISPKKNALAQGIAIARGEVIAFTDADCVVPSTWLASLNGHFEEGVAAVAGLTTYHPASTLNRFFWGLQSVDFFSHAVVSAGAIGAGIPLTVNANNFAVRRETYERAEEYRKVRDVVSGDDDLLLHAIDRTGGAPLRYCFEAAGAVTTEPTPDFAGVWEQRKRWGSKTIYYNRRQVALLTGVYFFYCLLFAAMTGAFFIPALRLPAFSGLIVKSAVDFMLLREGASRFGKTPLLPYFFPMALVHVPLIVFACLFGIFGRFRWKGAEFSRRV